MVADILSWTGSLIINFISNLGYPGIFILSAIESACIPVPSEVVLPFSGFLASTGRFSLWMIVLVGTAANLAGSLAAYAVGYFGGRKFIKRWGKYILLKNSDLELADSWFLKYGSAAVFFSRILPVVRTFISLPAGICRMKLPGFMIFTVLGALPWNAGLAYIGFKLGQNWPKIEHYFRRFDYLILGLVLIGAFWWIWRHFKKNNI
ncbi:MAG: DedA family protein [Candidatus Portnoybacteria bacterium]|nr:DedA family protein [Candidatus Portnoybacteria bacterium]